jgi:hypothetical protein
MNKQTLYSSHLPALLCHMPNVYDLTLTFGEEALKQEIITAISRGPQIRVLTIKDTMVSGYDSVVNLIGGSPNPWPYLKSISIKHADRTCGPFQGEKIDSPNINLKQIIVDYPATGHFDEVPWLIQHSKGITHITMISNSIMTINKHLKHPNLRNILSLTLGRVSWSNELHLALHTFNRLKELRIISLIRLERDFGQLPDTLEHLVLTTPFFQVPDGGMEVDLARPALLRTCQIVVVERALFCCDKCYHVENPVKIVPNNELWVTQYTSLCRTDGVHTLVHRISDRTGTCHFLSNFCWF